MYEALKGYLAHIEQFHKESGFPGHRCTECEDIEEDMRQALAKAEGRE